jgi:predicted nucleic acid-binding protein
MIVIDSSLWLEYFVDSDYSKIIENLLELPQFIIVPTIILTEIYKKIQNDWNKSVADDFIVQFQDYQIINLDFQNAVHAAKIGKDFKLPLADSIIYSTAINYNATLYTLDKHFQDLPNVKYFEKK